MDNQTKKSKSNWYFFRQRIRRMKVAFQQQQQIGLKVSFDLSLLRFHLNSTSHSLCIALSQISSLHNSLDKQQQILNITKAQTQVQHRIISNLKKQNQILHHKSQKLPNSIPPSPVRKKRKTTSMHFIPSPNQYSSTMDETSAQISSPDQYSFFMDETGFHFIPSPNQYSSTMDEIEELDLF
eukprot:TRINITY_DN642_c0_g2_i1.p1 TRINITY_DN642_c0_g2~~TRINITY_DN642_c0_g2_i1.p1  ORF type:complete len:182 (-),score=37.37 TRINITY_DN642_c0_g2_i1:147-692(-)